MAREPLDSTVVDLVDEWVSKTPDAVAVEWNGHSLTYAGLRNASLHVSKALLSAGAGPGDKIPILSRMSLEILPCILGVLRVGACYAPIDVPSWSKARVESTLKDLSSPVVLATVETNTWDLPAIVRFEEAWLQSSLDDRDELFGQLDAIRKQIDDQSLVYITFTSGTTGKPKGVMIYHHALYKWAALTVPDALDTAPGERALLAFSISFDACACVIWSTITRGGALVMALWSTFPELAKTCDTLMITPSMLATLNPAGPYEKVRRITLGAEAPNFEIARMWNNHKRLVIHTYGPSEATIVITYGRIREDLEPDLGVLNPGVEVFIVDEELREADKGEILIGGACLAAGYLNNPELTAKKFINWNGRRVYRTGDLARKTKDGMSWIGRADRTVKNRGFLVNLETEVEPAMLRFPTVQAASAFMWRDKLMGFVHPAEVSVHELRSFMTQNFDPFVVPDEIVVLPQLPLTINGKVDRAQLHSGLEDRMAKDDAALDAMVCSSPRDALRWAFAKCLQVPLSSLDQTSSFSQLGGNSLAAIRLPRLLRRQGYATSIVQVLKKDTIGLLEGDVTRISDSDGQQNGHVLASDAPLSTDLHRAMISQSQSDPLINCLIIRGKHVKREGSNPLPTPDELKVAWAKTFAAHSIFKTRWDTQDWTLHDTDHINLDWDEVNAEDDDFHGALLTVQEQMWTHHRKLQQHPSLEMPYSHMTCVYASGRKNIGFVWRVHHSLVDPFSIDILVQDLERALTKEHLQPGPRIQDYARFMQTFKHERLGTATEFWKRMMKPLGPKDSFEFRPPQHTLPEGSGWTILSFRTKTSVDSIEAAAARHNVSSATMIIAGWALLLTQYTHSNFAPFIVSRSGRMVHWPPADSLVAAMNCRVPFATSVPAEATVSDWLTNMHDLLFDVAEVENLSQSLHPSIAPEQYFKTGVQAFLHMPHSAQSWEIGDKLTGQPKPIGMVWRLESEKDRSIKAELEIDQRAVDYEWAREVGAVAVQQLEMLTKANGSTKLQNLTSEE